MKFKNVNTKNFDYLIALDLGITSLGWAVIEIDEENADGEKYDVKRLIDVGVRVWDSIEDEKGNLPSQKRREARGLRRVIDRRQQRLRKIKNIFIQNYPAVFKDKEFFESQEYFGINPYEVRVKGLDEALSLPELARAVLHLAKRRGFKSNAKDANKSEANKSDKGYKNAIQQTEQRRSERNYRTIGEMLLKDELFVERKRNEGENYIFGAKREMILQELKMILDKQVELGVINREIADQLYNTVGYQRPFATAESIKKNVGYCEIYKDEPRAPKYAPSVEFKSLWEKINNLTWVDTRNGKWEDGYLTDDLRQKLFELALEKEEITYYDIRTKVLGLSEEDKIYFKSCTYFDKVKSSKKSKKEKQDESQVEAEQSTTQNEGSKKSQEDQERWIRIPTKKAENRKFFALKGYHLLKNCGLSEDKFNPLFAELDKYDTADKLVEIMNYSYTKEELEQNLTNAGLSEYSKGLKNVYVDFSGTSNLSLRACREMLPLLRDQALKYSEALAYIRSNNPQEAVSKYDQLPEVAYDDIRNPVVHRAIAQTRKVVNALIQRYGKPSLIHIELAREMKLPKDERGKLSNQNRDREEKNKEIQAELERLGIPVNGTNITKFKLWKEQDHKCVYSGREITVDDFINSTEIDHILPFSRSLDDSINNKVLVFAQENQNKSDRTPFEYFGHDTERWERMKQIWTDVMKLHPSKIARLLTENYSQRDLNSFLERDSNDTKYASRFIKNYLENNLLFKESKKLKRRVYTFQGLLTSLLRKSYGLNKDREENLRHHALDAVIVGVANQKMLMRFTEWYKIKENRQKVLDKSVDPESIKFAPEPWPNFRKDVNIRIFSDNPIEELREEGILDKQYGEEYVRFIRPLFVSRMAKYKITGPIHEETVKSIRKINGKAYFIKTISLTELQKSNFEKDLNSRNLKGMIIADPETIRVLRERLEEYNWDAKQAFIEPIYKPSRNPERRNRIKRVKIVERPAVTYVTLKRGKGKGYADNGSIVRVDVFRRKGRYKSVPVYASWVGRHDLPTQYTPLKDNKHIDDTFEFCFSLYPGELVYLSDGVSGEYLYYVTMDSTASGQYNFRTHDGSHPKSGFLKKKGNKDSKKKEGGDKVKNLRKGITKLKVFEKKYIDVLGFIHDVKKMKRMPLLLKKR